MKRTLLSHLSKTFPGGVRAVEDLCLEVDDGELLAVMGPSGCGKTTTLRLIAGLEQPTSGSITIAGCTVDRLPPRERDVAMVFQQGALYPHLSVRSNMAFGLKMRRTPRHEIAPRVAEAADVLGITDLLDRRPGELSYGQQQRVALGRAMVRRPKLFLLDEPLASLDATLRLQLRQEIRGLHRRLGVPMIYVTHDAGEAMALGQRIAVMRKGRLQQVSDPQTLYDRPDNRFVAASLGSPGMNFLEGRLIQNNGHLALAVGGCSEVAIPGPCRAAIAPHVGNPVILGVRPEHLQLDCDAVACPAFALPARVEAVERLGADTHIYLRAENQVLVARTHGKFGPENGTLLCASALPEHLHFFDPATEAAIR